MAWRAAVAMVTQKYPFLHSHGFSRSQPPLLPENQGYPGPVHADDFVLTNQCFLTENKVQFLMGSARKKGSGSGERDGEQ